ncbi:MAG: nucleotidyltransferase family protein [Phototrophicaceae bacterium]
MITKELQARIPLEKVKIICEHWHIIEFAVFGSVTNNNFKDDSDIDILITFADDTSPTLFDMITITTEFEAILGRKVDLLTYHSIQNSPNYIRKRDILNSMQVLYAS